MLYGLGGRPSSALQTETACVRPCDTYHWQFRRSLYACLAFGVYHKDRKYLHLAVHSGLHIVRVTWRGTLFIGYYCNIQSSLWDRVSALYTAKHRVSLHTSQWTVQPVLISVFSILCAILLVM